MTGFRNKVFIASAIAPIAAVSLPGIALDMLTTSFFMRPVPGFVPALRENVIRALFGIFVAIHTTPFLNFLGAPVKENTTLFAICE